MIADAQIRIAQATRRGLDRAMIEDLLSKDEWVRADEFRSSATQLIARVRDRYQVGLPIRKFMTSPTLPAFAHAVAVAQWVARPQLGIASDNQTEKFLMSHLFGSRTL